MATPVELEQLKVGGAPTSKEHNFVRPSEIHSVWRTWCQSANVSLQECHWTILDAIYAGHEEGLASVRKALFTYEVDLEYLRRRAARNAADASNFDCDDIAFYLRGKINGRAQSLGMPLSFCFGVAVITYPDIFQLRRQHDADALAREVARVIGNAGLLDASIQVEHAINWMITKNEHGTASLQWVEIVEPSSDKVHRLGVEKRTVKLAGETSPVTPPDIIINPLPTELFRGGSINMIVV